MLTEEYNEPVKVNCEVCLGEFILTNGLEVTIPRNLEFPTAFKVCSEKCGMYLLEAGEFIRSIQPEDVNLIID